MSENDFDVWIPLDTPSSSVLDLGLLKFDFTLNIFEKMMDLGQISA